MTQKFFIDRRTGDDRRSGESEDKNGDTVPDPGRKQRRRQVERRSGDSVAGDFYAMHGMEPEDFKSPGSTH